MRSNIYSLNSNIEGFRPIAAGLAAVELGTQFGAPAYVTAAVRRLHITLEPLACSGTQCKGKYTSPIHPSDITFVCTHDVGQGAKLLLFHAVAAHWKAVEAARIREDTDWAAVYDEYPEFEGVIKGSVETEDGVRGMYLAKVEMYLDEVREREREKCEERKRGLVREVVLGRLRGDVGVGRWGRSARGSRFGSGRGTAIGGGSSSGSGSALGQEGQGGHEEQAQQVEQTVLSGLSENDWMVVDVEGDGEI